MRRVLGYAPYAMSGGLGAVFGLAAWQWCVVALPLIVAPLVLTALHASSEEATGG